MKVLESRWNLIDKVNGKEVLVKGCVGMRNRKIAIANKCQWGRLRNRFDMVVVKIDCVLTETQGE